MRGLEDRSDALFIYVSPESFVPEDHPLRPIRIMADKALASLSQEFDRLYSHTGRPSVPPEVLLKSLLLQILFSIRSNRQLVEQLSYNILFRWILGVSLEDRIWDHSTFSQNQGRLIGTDIAGQFLQKILAQAKEKNSLADVAKAQNISLRQSEFFSRQDPDKDLKLLKGASLTSIFSLQDSKPFPESPLELGNRFMVCQFQGKNPAGQPSEEEKAEISGRITRQKQRAVWDAWLTGIRKVTKVERFKEI